MKKKLIDDNILVALDIGTTKICVLVAQKNQDNNLDIIGVGHVPSLGLSRGVIVDISQAVESIKLAIKEAELISGAKIKAANVGISGAHIQSINSSGTTLIRKNRVTSQDINNALNCAKSIVIPDGQQILHVLPQYFIIDSDQKVSDPMGMFGIKLEVKTHIITGSIGSVQNIIKCCELAGIRVLDVVLEHLASAQAVLSQDEQFLGSGVLDIGGGTSDFAIYQNNAVKYTKVLSIAGNHITKDIALCLRTTIKDAERIKCSFGSSMLNEDQIQTCQVELAQGNAVKSISSLELTAIIEPRVKELLLMLHHEIYSQRLKHLMPAGLVLTGGGSLLKNFKESAKEILGMPVRLGYPSVSNKSKEMLNSPIYATGYGLLLDMLKKKEEDSINHLSSPWVNRIFSRMKSWVTDLF